MNYTQELESKFDLLFVNLVQTYEDGRYLYTCMDGSKPSLLTVDADKVVLIKNHDSAFWDYLGGVS